MIELEFKANYLMLAGDEDATAVLEALTEAIRDTFDELGVMAVGTCDIEKGRKVHLFGPGTTNKHEAEKD